MCEAIVFRWEKHARASNTLCSYSAHTLYSTPSPYIRLCMIILFACAATLVFAILSWQFNYLPSSCVVNDGVPVAPSTTTTTDPVSLRAEYTFGWKSFECRGARVNRVSSEICNACADGQNKHHRTVLHTSFAVYCKGRAAFSHTHTHAALKCMCNMWPLAHTKARAHVCIICMYLYTLVRFASCKCGQSERDGVCVYVHVLL